jgi:hypothetical protein
MIEESLLTVREAFDAVPFLVIRETGFKSDQINLLCRSEDSTPDNRQLLGVIHHLMESEDGWQSHICQRFFMRDGSMKFGWSFSFRSDDMGMAAGKIAKAVRFHVKTNVMPVEKPAVVKRDPIRNTRSGDQSPLPGSRRGAHTLG